MLLVLPTREGQVEEKKAAQSALQQKIYTLAILVL